MSRTACEHGCETVWGRVGLLLSRPGKAYLRADLVVIMVVRRPG